MSLTALDLYCGGGGVCAGLSDAGFVEIEGWDIEEKHGRYYPGSFMHGDALTVPSQRLAAADFVWASPPCQRWSLSTRYHGKQNDHPDLVAPTREMLTPVKAWVIENVAQAPIYPDIVLSGPMVGLTRIKRIRHFEVSPWLRERMLMRWSQPPVIVPPKEDWENGHAITVTKSMSASSHFYARKRRGLRGRVPRDEAAQAMGIKHRMTLDEIGEAVPPPMAAYIGELVHRILVEDRA